jgi:hypothetical protein
MTTIRATCQPRGASGPHISDEYMGHVSDARPGPRPGIFIGDVSPTNVIGYIHRFYVTDEYIITFVSTDE